MTLLNGALGGPVLAALVPALAWLAAMGVLAGSAATPARSAPLVIAGADMTCKDFRGRTVMTMEVAELGDVGRAWVVNTVPYIILDPEVLRRLPVKLQQFFFAHECAHHALAHWFNPSPESEKEADCWAIRHGRERGLFTRQDVADFAPWFAASKGSRLGHLPGPERSSYLLACFDETIATASTKEIR